MPFEMSSWPKSSFTTLEKDHSGTSLPRQSIVPSLLISIGRNMYQLQLLLTVLFTVNSSARVSLATRDHWKCCKNKSSAGSREWRRVETCCWWYWVQANAVSLLCQSHSHGCFRICRHCLVQWSGQFCTFYHLSKYMLSFMFYSSTSTDLKRSFD